MVDTLVVHSYSTDWDCIPW